MPVGERHQNECHECHSMFETSTQKKHAKFCCRTCAVRHKAKTENLSDETRMKLTNNAISRHIRGDENFGFSTRKKFQSSFPEKLAEEFLTKQGIGFTREVKLGKWFADFLFDDKIVLEIDGQQHNLPERKVKDAEKDVFLSSQGYKVVRIPFSGPNESFFNALRNFVLSKEAPEL